MRRLTIAISALALILGGGGWAAVQAQPGYGQQRWDAPPPEFNQAQRQGFLAGIDGAQKDFGNHRSPDPNNRWEYQRPNVPPELVEAYRDGFRRGYDRAMSHLMGAGYRSQYPVAPPPPQYVPQGPGYGPQGPGRPPQAEPWAMAPSGFSDLQQRGFRDGIEGARKDFGNNRAPDVNNRDEYRHPDLNGPERRVYRQAFKQGYQMAASHLWGGGRGRY